MPHSPSTSTITGQKARALLLDQLARLNEVIANSDRPDLVAHARNYARNVSVWLDQYDDALRIMAGKFGDNGWGPGIDAICREAARREPVRFVCDADERVAA